MYAQTIEADASSCNVSLLFFPLAVFPFFHTLLVFCVLRVSPVISQRLCLPGIPHTGHVVGTPPGGHRHYGGSDRLA